MSRWLDRLLFNRNTVTLGILAVAAGFWNLYVALNDDGILAGHVQDASGRAAADVNVFLFKQELIGLERVAKTRTDTTGAFRFKAHNQHKPILQLENPDGTLRPSVEVRLMFRNQNKVLQKPLRLP